MSSHKSASFDEAAYRFLSRHRRIVAYTLYAGGTSIGYASAFLLRFELRWPAAYLQTFLLTLPFLLAVRLGGHAVFKFATGRWRYVGVSDVFRLLGSSLLGTLVFAGALQLLRPSSAVPSSVILIELVLSIYLIGGLWLAYRLIFQTARRWGQTTGGMSKKILIIGAGEAGSRLVHEMVTFATGYVRWDSSTATRSSGERGSTAWW